MLGPHVLALMSVEEAVGGLADDGQQNGSSKNSCGGTLIAPGDDRVADDPDAVGW